MSRPRKSSVGIVVFGLLIVGLAGYFIFKPDNYPSKDWQRSKLTVKEREVTVFLAQTPLEREEGLSGFDSINDKEGMLFKFDAPSQPGFWMRNMRFDIDIIWILNDKIVEITPDIKVDDGEMIKYYPNQDVNKVLEVNAGWCEEFEISEGDNVVLE